MGGDEEASKQTVSPLCTGSQFPLKVLVRDAVNRQPLPGASVDIYVNHTLSGSFHTEAPAGDTVLQVPYSTSLTLLGRKDGYLPVPLPWSATKRPREYKQQLKHSTLLSESLPGKIGASVSLKSSKSDLYHRQLVAQGKCLFFATGSSLVHSHDSQRSDL